MGSFPFHDFVGILGVLIYTSSFTALQLGRLDGNSPQYSLLNGIAAALVLFSLYKNFNLASALIQIVWISVSTVGIYRHVRHKFGSENRIWKRSPTTVDIAPAFQRESQKKARATSEEFEVPEQLHLRKKQQ